MAEKKLEVLSKKIFFRYAEQVVEEMKGIVSGSLVSKIHSVPICRAFCYLQNKTSIQQSLPFECFVMGADLKDYLTGF